MNRPLVAPVNRPLFAGVRSETGPGRRGPIGGRYARGGTHPTPGVSSGGAGTEGVLGTGSGQAKPQIFSGPEKACTGCGVSHPRTLDWFPSDGRKADGLRARCRQCMRDKANAWVAANPERVRSNVRAYRAANPKSYRAVKDGWRVEDPAAARLVHRVRSRVAKALGRAPKGHYSLGCSAAELRVHIERQFLKGMSWSNRADWHIDHIRPLASFDLTDPEQLRAACHFSNLRPLWAEDNLRKGASPEVLI